MFLREKLAPEKEGSLLQTHCNQESYEFHPLNQRQVVGRFDGGAITSDAGGLLLREVGRRTRVLAQFAACFRDCRDPERLSQSPGRTNRCTEREAARDEWQGRGLQGAALHSNSDTTNLAGALHAEALRRTLISWPRNG